MGVETHLNIISERWNFNRIRRCVSISVPSSACELAEQNKLIAHTAFICPFLKASKRLTGEMKEYKNDVCMYTKKWQSATRGGIKGDVQVDREH